jgi:hypothetical protein
MNNSNYAAIRKLTTALDDMRMPLGPGGWESCVSDILDAAPALVSEVVQLRADRDALLARIRELEVGLVDTIAKVLLAERTGGICQENYPAPCDMCDCFDGEGIRRAQKTAGVIAGAVRAALAAPIVGAP